MTYPDLSCQNTLTTHYRHITTADTRQMHMHYTIRNKKRRDACTTCRHRA